MVIIRSDDDPVCVIMNFQIVASVKNLISRVQVFVSFITHCLMIRRVRSGEDSLI